MSKRNFHFEAEGVYLNGTTLWIHKPVSIWGFFFYDTLSLHASPMNLGCMSLTPCVSLKMNLILTSKNPEYLRDQDDSDKKANPLG